MNKAPIAALTILATAAQPGQGEELKEIDKPLPLPEEILIDHGEGFFTDDPDRAHLINVLNSVGRTMRIINERCSRVVDKKTFCLPDGAIRIGENQYEGCLLHSDGQSVTWGTPDLTLSHDSNSVAVHTGDGFFRWRGDRSLQRVSFDEKCFGPRCRGNTYAGESPSMNSKYDGQLVGIADPKYGKANVERAEAIIKGLRSQAEKILGHSCNSVNRGK